MERLPDPDEFLDDFYVTEAFRYRAIGNILMADYFDKKLDEITSEPDGYIIDD